MKEIPKAYEPRNYEDKIYAEWERSGFFNPDNLDGKPYSIMMPPPNVTGVLHLGHALENALMDTMARYQRLRGKKVLLLPGTDHAAVATQAKVEKLLMEKGIKNPRAELGREGLLKEIREFAEKSKSTILSQIKKMGTSCDWSRLAYTFDEPRSAAVNEIFKRMYDDGLIYRGFRAVNWSVKGQSTLSDDEIVYVERKAKFYTFKYGKSFPFTIATTRPETKLGDTAVAVNPKDARYKKHIGKIFKVNFVGVPLTLKIIADRGVDMKFGTGALGVTPAHSLVDYEMSVKNDLPIIKVIGEDGKMTNEAGKFAGLTVAAAREKIVEELKKQKLLVKEEEVDQNVGTSDRFGDVVEVLPMTQWFVAVNKKISGRNKTLKDLMKETVGPSTSSGSKKVNITPDRFQKIYFQWIDNLRDWCISRQIYWGHRIPVWYKKEITNDELRITNKENIYVGGKPPKGDWVQDSDTLDTWFSSGLWTFSTLGWPRNIKSLNHKIIKSGDLKEFHPTSWMQMGHEILFFWMARMILMSEYVLKEIPFKNVYIHGILRDEKGNKFSKSAGNAVDPLEVTAKYGTDALRLSLLSGVSPGQDQRFYEDKVEGARNMVNKLWNVSRYIITQKDNKIKKPIVSDADVWIQSKFDDLLQQVTDNLEGYHFSEAAEALRNFTWDDFADWYIEISKKEGGKEKILKEILEKLLVLWHPFLPFVTEAIWKEMLGKKDLIVVKWPARKTKIGETNPQMVRFVEFQHIVRCIRSLKAAYNVAQNKNLTAIVYAHRSINFLKQNKNIANDIKDLAGLKSVVFEKSGSKPDGSVSMAFRDLEIYLILKGTIDLEKEKVRLRKELAEKESYAVSLKKKLSNKEFVARAPKAVVDAEKEKLAKAEDEIKNLKEQLKAL